MAELHLFEVETQQVEMENRKIGSESKCSAYYLSFVNFGGLGNSSLWRYPCRTSKQKTTISWVTTRLFLSPLLPPRPLERSGEDEVVVNFCFFTPPQHPAAIATLSQLARLPLEESEVKQTAVEINRASRTQPP